MSASKTLTMHPLFTLPSPIIMHIYSREKEKLSALMKSVNHHDLLFYIYSGSLHIHLYIVSQLYIYNGRCGSEKQQGYIPTMFC